MIPDKIVVKSAQEGGSPIASEFSGTFDIMFNDQSLQLSVIRDALFRSSLPDTQCNLKLSRGSPPAQEGGSLIASQVLRPVTPAFR